MADDGNVGIFSLRTNSKGRKLRNARWPSVEAKSKHTTKNYLVWNEDLHVNLQATPVTSRNLSMSDNSGRPLCISNALDTDHIPTNCLIDDYNLGKLLDSCNTPQDWKRLHDQFPSQIDSKGMPKARTLPLGFASKTWVIKGTKDRPGNKASKDQEGWYYRWLWGLHILCEEKGIQRYMIRPSFEDKMKEKWSYDLDYACVLQEEEHGPAETALVMSLVATQVRAAKHPLIFSPASITTSSAAVPINSSLAASINPSAATSSSLQPQVNSACAYGKRGSPSTESSDESEDGSS